MDTPDKTDKADDIDVVDESGRYSVILCIKNPLKIILWVFVIGYGNYMYLLTIKNI